MEGGDELLSATWLSLWVSACAVALAAVVAIPLGAVIGLAPPRVRVPLAVASRVAMAFPTVLVGLLVYGLLSRHGPLGSLGLLFTPQAIVMGELLLAFPLIVALVETSIASLDVRFRETTRALGLSRTRTAWLALSETRDSVRLALLAAFARCVTELGVAMLVGGNLRGETRTLTTSIALETSMGHFDRAVRLGWVLVALALAFNVAVALLRRRTGRP